jgi:hydroxymethylbilane synthase
MNPIRLGTRGSKLALIQAETIKAMLEREGHAVEIVVIRTSGDDGRRDVIGAFVKEIQLALLDNRVDVALHCLKDLPTERVAGLDVAAYLERHDYRDALISKVGGLDELPSGAIIGTGSARRRAQLAALRPDFKMAPLVGNVDTRLRKMLDGEYDAIVLAIAGLIRLKWLENWESTPYAEAKIQILGPELMLPAPGQGILVLETREDDDQTNALISKYDNAASRHGGIAERALLKEFGGGCSLPVASLAEFNESQITVHGMVGLVDGSKVVRSAVTGQDPVLTAEHSAQILLDQGAREMVAASQQPPGGSA